MRDRSVSAGGDVSRSVIVTGDGNAVSLRIGSSGLVLPLDRKQIAGPDRRRQQEEEERPRELDVLNPAQGRLPLLGRDAELDDLKAWLESDVDISVHALTGPAGTGKTRLAIGLCAAIDNGQKPSGDWVAAFLSASELPRLAEVYATTTFEWEQSTLLVIDYAAQGYQALGRWLDRLATKKLDGVKLRILLLERQAPKGYGWWHELRDSPLNAAAKRQDLFRRPRPESLQGLRDLEIRRRIVAEALSATAKLYDMVGGAVPAPGEDKAFDARLSEPAFGNALSLVMAGVIGHEKGLKPALALRRLDAARHLGRRELVRFEKLAGAAPEDKALRHLVAFNGMTGGLPIAGLGKTLQTELAEIGMVANTARLSELLQQELPPPATREEGRATAPRLGTIQPDLIGEAVVVEAFEAPPDRQEEGVPTVQRAYALTGATAAQALMHLLQDYAYAIEDPGASDKERESGTRLLDWLQRLASEIKDPEVLTPLASALPEETLVLREIAAEITGRLAKAYGAVLADGEEVSLQAVYRAMAWSGNHAVRLSDTGDREAALVAAEWATQLARSLFELDADTFRDDLAMSLNNLANRLSALGKREDALAAAEEALELYRALAAARPDAFTPDLAGSLNNLANRLSDLGKREDALAAAEEAVELRRALAAARPDAFTPDLAGSLNNLANVLSDLGKREDALAAAEEAVKLRRALAAARPDAFTPDLATSLNNLANFLSALGKREDALTAAEEAVKLRRALAAARPDAFTPDLATSLNNLAGFLSALGKREEALTAAEEAVELRRALAAARPDAFTPNLATSLNNLANFLSDLGKREEALAAAEEAVELYRALAAARPEAFTVELSTSLGMFTDLMIAMDDKTRALETIEEAIQVLAPVFLALPSAVAHWMQMHLQRYLSLCKELGRDPDLELLMPILETLQKQNDGKDQNDDS